MNDRKESEYRRTVFGIPKMDCPSEERHIRLALECFAEVKKLSFDLSSNQLVAIHTGASDGLLLRLVPLNYGAGIVESRVLGENETKTELAAASDDVGESRVLSQLLAINGGMFFIELGAGWWAQSTGLIADSLDMFADAAVYGISLYAVGKTIQLKRHAAKLSGCLQLVLALGVVVEVVRRFVFGSGPEGAAMMLTATAAFAANLSCLILLMKHRTGGVHMRASWIFSTNDVIANLGVIISGAIVLATGSAIPDLAIGSIIALVVFSGAIRILRVAKG